MSFNGIYQFGQFGTLTTKSGKVINFDDIDTDKDGKISQQEFNFIQKELGLDTVEFFNKEQNAEKSVTDYEFVWWQQEGKMQETLDKLISKVAVDFIGNNAQYASQVIKELRSFMNEFKEDYKTSSKSIIEMSDAFTIALNEKYESLKQEYLQTK